MSRVVKKQKEALNRGETEALEQESAHMEKKLALLRDMIQLEEKQQEKKKSQREAQGASWKSASTARPLRRGYIDDVSTSRKKGVTSTRNGSGGVGAPTNTALATATKAAAAASSTIKGAASAEKENPLASFVAGLYGQQEVADALSPSKPTKSAGAANGTSTAKPSYSPKAGSAAAPDNGAATSSTTPSVASSNLAAALQKQKSDLAEVGEVLARLGLTKYADAFEENGFDSKDVILEMNEDHMQELGMAMGHRIKLRKWIEKHQEEAAAQLPAATSSSRKVVVVAGEQSEALKGRSSGSSTSSGGGGGILKKSMPARLRDEVERSKSTTVIGLGTSGGSLLDGEYDEAAQAASFKEAVAAWRQQKPAAADVTTANAPSRTVPLLARDESEDAAEAAAFKEAVMAWRQQKPTAAETTVSAMKQAGLLEREAEEAAEAAAFKDAVMAWRQQEPKAQEEQEESYNEEGGEGLASFGAATLQFKLRTGEQGDGEGQPPARPARARKACYSCYKQFYEGDGIVIAGGKEVCSATCEAAEKQKEERRKEIAQRRREQIAEIAAQQNARETEKQRLLSGSATVTPTSRASPSPSAMSPPAAGILRQQQQQHLSSTAASTSSTGEDVEQYKPPLLPPAAPNSDTPAARSSQGQAEASEAPAPASGSVGISSDSSSSSSFRPPSTQPVAPAVTLIKPSLLSLSTAEASAPPKGWAPLDSGGGSAPPSSESADANVGASSAESSGDKSPVFAIFEAQRFAGMNAVSILNENLVLNVDDDPSADIAVVGGAGGIGGTEVGASDEGASQLASFHDSLQAANMLYERM
mmetsp:Transcript_22843/g.57757  ORF Transcript_22843/g.57757 Transcript_22843/m.57757 type:complete len:817 (-) Transcript_22843:334-2784(-)|eukprot:CAMPEP_0178991382 /NCGR_PEP_ID=MMETSP0795-20121207/5494_1 /TAXON_ID=88552 /ORGANISM="Amoebophrya sp., Strain Ameob2" /LENGTH=816 /DNA_ID=CAMNT_0020683079 /DNA_START=166 /DNA_END=2616 /DNA_ORIENTATION=+